MLNESDLLNRITKVKNLKEDCFKYLESSSKELLTQKVIFAIAELTSEKMEPVKLSELAQKIYNTTERSKQDVLRLTIEKSLLKCGIVEKLRYSVNDVRYILIAYRYKKVKKIESFRGDIDEETGEIFELSKSTWPIGEEYFILKAKQSGCEEAIKKLNSDYDGGTIPRGKYENLLQSFNNKLSQINKTLDTKFKDIDELMGR